MKKIYQEYIDINNNVFVVLVYIWLSFVGWTVFGIDEFMIMLLGFFFASILLPLENDGDVKAVTKKKKIVGYYDE
jgi:hypothetical protein